MASQNKSNSVDAAFPAGFGAYLRECRVRRELTLREVAAAVGMDQAHLSKAELGQRLPTPAQVQALARFFREDLVEFEARHIAEKFRRRHAGSAAALHAVRLLHGEQQQRTIMADMPRPIRRKTTTARSMAAKPAAPAEAPEMLPVSREASELEENPGVLVLHVD
jgi:transcriptional regulator with XRE-family HTH domain